METITKRAFFNSWSTEPIPHLSISASGLIALADLSTIAQRTALAGGSSWLDSLLLAPGLHYQQAADALARETASFAVTATETQPDGTVLTYVINNQATVNYLERVARPGRVVTLDVGQIPPRYRGKARRRRRQSLGQRGTVWAEDGSPDLGWVSHLLYLISPLLTCVVFAFLIMMEDWWGLAFLLALMLSRVLNIWVIKQRTKPPADDPDHDRHDHDRHDRHHDHHHDHGGHHHNLLTEYLVDLGPGRGGVILRGMADDLRAVTASAWLRPKTFAEGYLEATAKVIVYLVASFSGNVTQAGSIALMALLLVSAALLALSNAHARGLRNNGRVVAPEPGTGGDGSGRGDGKHGTPGDPPYPLESASDSSWPGSSAASGFTGMDDWAEKGQVGNVRRDTGGFEKRVEYS